MDVTHFQFSDEVFSILNNNNIKNKKELIDKLASRRTDLGFHTYSYLD